MWAGALFGLLLLVVLVAAGLFVLLFVLYVVTYPLLNIRGL
ncbi:hypothetical protein B0I33_103151 [Prauserella shujinwangii]|uniref:Uncharacterized protein n=2 Tax=Prauserella shujinwangii TaxID=1453103 RepID=A0A2T0LYC2_9PSEU|nr:hypothetical protein B0I33_103151 [Prauserella shujinwangii]